MVRTLANRLDEARRQFFVGRTSELADFQAALVGPTLLFHVLYIFGPGGVGKTTLLREYAHVCALQQLQVSYLDARGINPTPESFLSALPFAVQHTPNGGMSFQTPSSECSVLLIDTYELLAPLDSWLGEVFLPDLPEQVLVVIAGRNPPSRAWRSDPGLQSVARLLPLRNLRPEEGRAYLTKRGLPVEQHTTVLQFTHGHPLALSLVADLFAQRGDATFGPEAAPDIVKPLMEQLVQKVPGPAHRTALEACAIVQSMTEGLLQAMVAAPDAHELFEWLRELSFIESGPLGLFPHDLAREVLAADLRWRNPEWYAELHKRARTYYNVRLQQTTAREQERILSDYIFLHRDNPVVRPFFAHLEEQGGAGAPSVVTDVARPADVPLLVAMVAQHEGEASAQLAEHWLSRQLDRALVFRDGQQAVGFLLLLGLEKASPEDITHDPATAAAWAYLQRTSPLRPGESATHFRFWMAAATHQRISSVQSLIFINMVRHYLTTPGLAYTFLPSAQPDFWTPIFAYAYLERLPEADFEVGGRSYSLYGHDWRTMPPTTWLELLAQREFATMSGAQATPSPVKQSVVVLSQPDFWTAVREALRFYGRPEVLRDNPLLRARFLVEQCGADSPAELRITVLRELIAGAGERMKESPKEERFYKTLLYTYFHPAPSQEQAADLLDLPFSTYRRHLKTAVTRVTEQLWQRETAPWGK